LVAEGRDLLTDVHEDPPSRSTVGDASDGASIPSVHACEQSLVLKARSRIGVSNAVAFALDGP